MPIGDGDFATGVVARSTRWGKVILGYFFGPRRRDVPSLEEVSRLRPDQALRVARFGDLGLIEGSWPIVGVDPNWKRTEWPCPQFVRHEPIIERWWLVTYDDRNPNRHISDERLSGPRDDLGRDSMHGAGAIEILLRTVLPK